MTSNNFLFSNFRLTIIYIVFGFIFLFGGAIFLHKTDYVLASIGGSVLFLVLALHFIMKGNGKENEQVKRL